MKRFAGAMAALCCAGAADARPLPDGGVTPQEVMQVLQQEGYKAELDKDSAGDPMVRSAAEGLKFDVYFYGCEDNRCKSIEFVVGLDLEKGTTLQKAADWNKEYRFARLALDDEMDAWFHYDIDVERGATTEAIENALERWIAVLPDARKFLDF